MIKLKDFVDVNLTSVTPTSNEENKTVVYMYGGSTSIDMELNASNYEELLDNFSTKAQDFINEFFDLGGASLRVICVAQSSISEESGYKANNEKFIKAVNDLPMAQVAVVLSASSGQTTTGYDISGYYYNDFEYPTTDPETGEPIEKTFESLKELLKAIKKAETEKGTAFRKLLVKAYAPANGTAYAVGELEALLPTGEDKLLYNNLIYKLCKDEVDTASVLAYLSKVTIAEPETLRDYCFTVETGCENMSSALVNYSWSKVKKSFNFDMDLQQNNTVINLGGNTSTGYDIIQEFESVYIAQRLVNKELDLLKGKLDLSNAKSIIHSGIIEVMEVYYNIGYLVQTEYTGKNIYRNVNGKNICILANGEVVTGGYKVIILPKKVDADIHEFPEIELVISTNKGIRFIKTTGVVL